MGMTDTWVRLDGSQRIRVRRIMRYKTNPGVYVDFCIVVLE